MPDVTTLNAILDQKKSPGKTGGGVKASQDRAKSHLAKAQKLKAMVEDLGTKYNVPPAVILALMARESDFGEALDKGWGDHNNAFGVLQVDKRHHKVLGMPDPLSKAHVDQALGIWVGMLAAVHKAHKDWSEAEILAGAICAYNAGDGNVRTRPNNDANWRKMDDNDPNTDYSADVWAMAAFYRDAIWGKAAAAPSAKPETSKPPETGKPHAAPSIDDVRKGKAELQKGDKGDSVKLLQKELAAKGYELDQDGDYGPQTEGVVKDFQKDNKIEQNGKVGATTLKAIEAPAPPGPKGGNLASPWLKTLATSKLNTGETGYCVKTTLTNMDRLKVPTFEGGTAADPNNPRGAMALMIKGGKWVSLQLPGSKLETIKSPAYGTVQAYVLDGKLYKAMADAGKAPSGAIIFQSMTGWNTAVKESHGNDMGIVRDGGKHTFNYDEMPPIVYTKAPKVDVVLLVPK